MAIRIVNPSFKALALLKRGANKVNYSILKTDKSIAGKIFTEESPDEKSIRENFVDSEDVKTSAIILDELSDIYKECKDEKTKLSIEELLNCYNEQLPDVEDQKTITASDFLGSKTLTAEEFLNKE